MAFPHILKKEDKGVYQIQISIDFIDLYLPWLAYQRSPLRYDIKPSINAEPSQSIMARLSIT